MKRLYHLLVIFAACLSLSTLASCCDNKDEILIDEEEQEEYAEKIIGTWLRTSSQEYWRFDNFGTGENWNAAEDINEGEGNKFKWEFERNGLMVIYLLNGSYSDPEPDAPFIINTISDYSMTWTTNNGRGDEQSFSKVR